MNIKELFTEDRGVSPVIGVILMVAITVILAAVIGAFVIGLGDQASETTPQVSFSFDFDGDDVDISHAGGEKIQNTSITVTVDGVEKFNETENNEQWENGISAGDTLTLTDVGGDEETIRVIWTGDSGSSSILAERDFP